MVRKSVKITVCTMAAVMAFSGMNITANAAASSSVLPSGGIELADSYAEKDRITDEIANGFAQVRFRRCFLFSSSACE